MSSDDGPPSGAPPKGADLVAQADQVFYSVARSLGDALKRVERGEFDRAGDMAAAVRELRKALGAAIHERQSLERSETDGGGAALDLAAARAEIGGRLARLRAAADAGGAA